MIEQFKSIGRWFFNQTKANQIVIIFACVLIVAYYDRAEFKTELNALKNDRKRMDSTYVARINNLNRDYQKKIDDCNKERIKVYYEQNEIYKKKFDEVFLKTDFLYQQQEINKTK